MNIKKKRKNKREMLSYEDKPIEEYERDREIKKRKKLPKFKNKKVRNVLIIGIIFFAYRKHIFFSGKGRRFSCKDKRKVCKCQ